MFFCVQTGTIVEINNLKKLDYNFSYLRCPRLVGHPVEEKKQFSLCDIINITIYIWLNLKIKLYSVFVLIFSSKNPSE